MNTVAATVLAYPGWGHMHNTSGWIWGPIMMMLLIAASVGVIAWLVARTVGARAPEPRASGVEHAREILAERFARGEIDSDEYTDRLARLG